MFRELRAGRETVVRTIKNDLLGWICERHATDRTLDRRLLRDKALALAGEYGLTDLNCSERWLTCFLKKHGFPLNLDGSSGPIFTNYRLWIDIMRPVIDRYNYKDLFHLDELTMYADLPPDGIASAIRSAARCGEPDATPKRVTVLMCCNASGTEKLPLLICGSYPGSVAITCGDHEYNYSEDASISDELFEEWLSRLNDRMSRSGRKILLLLHRDRINVSRNFELSNVARVFFPDDFPPILRPLKRDVFRFVKMIYRSKFVKGIKEHGMDRWNVENVVRSLAKAWRKIPRGLIIASFQRTSFRTDDCFLEIHCDEWEDLKTGVPFEKFVTFDDDLSPVAAHGCQKSPGQNHNYNLRTREIVTLDDLPDSATDPRRRISIDDARQRPNENSKKTNVEADVNCNESTASKRSYEARSDESAGKSNAMSDDDSIVRRLGQTSRKDSEDVAVAPPRVKTPRIVGIEVIGAARRRDHAAKPEEIDRTRATANVASTSSGTSCVRKSARKATDREERREDDRGFSDERPIESTPRAADANRNDIAPRRALNDTFVVDSNATGHHDSISSQGSLKRKRSCSVDSTDEPAESSHNDREPTLKRPKSGSNWTKKYETTFVFGSPPDVARNAFAASVGALPDDDALLDLDAQRPRPPRRSCEMERSIFTIRPGKN